MLKNSSEILRVRKTKTKHCNSLESYAVCRQVVVSVSYLRIQSSISESVVIDSYCVFYSSLA